MSDTARSCARCAFAERRRVAPTALERQLFCLRFPPSPVAVAAPGPGGRPAVGMSAMFPPVHASLYCFEFREANGAKSSESSESSE